MSGILREHCIKVWVKTKTVQSREERSFILHPWSFEQKWYRDGHILKYLHNILLHLSFLSILFLQHGTVKVHILNNGNFM